MTPPAWHLGCRQPLRGDSGRGRDFRQVRGFADGHRPSGPSRRHDSLRVEGIRPPGGLIGFNAFTRILISKGQYSKVGPVKGFQYSF